MLARRLKTEFLIEFDGVRIDYDIFCGSILVYVFFQLNGPN